MGKGVNKLWWYWMSITAVIIVRTILLIRVILIREYSYHTHTWNGPKYDWNPFVYVYIFIYYFLCLYYYWKIISITKKNQKNQKIGKRISRIIRERLQTSTKVEVREYHKLWLQHLRRLPLPHRYFWSSFDSKVFLYYHAFSKIDHAS